MCKPHGIEVVEEAACGGFVGCCGRWRAAPGRPRVQPAWAENGVGGVSSLHQGIGLKALHPWILSSVDSASGESVTAWVDRLHRGIERRLLHGWILHWGMMCAYLKKKSLTSPATLSRVSVPLNGSPL